MARADGSIIVKADVDDRNAEKKLSQLNKTIENTEKKLSDLQAKRLPLVEQAKELGVALDEAKAKLSYMESGTEFFPDSAIKQQTAAIKQMQKEWDAVNNKLDDVNGKISAEASELAAAKQEAGNLTARMTSFGYKAGEAVDAASFSLDRFKTRILKLAKRILVFSLITMALRGVREWMGKVVKTNGEATAAMGRLKGALLTLAQPLVNVVIPAFTALLNVLTAIVGEVSRIVSGLFGTTAEQSAEAAKGLQEEVDALEATGAAAKKSGKSLASFDEINRLSAPGSAGGGGQAETVAPDFSWADGISEKLRQIARDVLLIGAGFALWKIGSALPGTLGLILTKLGGILIALGGFKLLYDSITDAWENGIDWGNLAGMLAGVAAAAFGLKLAFGPILGPIAAGIALVVSGLAMLVTGFNDVIKNGANLQNVLTIIAGIIATGLGISLITGTWIPLLIAGIASIVVAIIAWQGNLEEFADAFKHIFGGIADFLKGVFTGDVELAVKGIQNIVIGVVNAIIIAFESFVNTVIDGINWLIKKANSIAGAVGIKKTIPEIQKLDLGTIPYLAQGAVIPPNREFMAVLGDQKSGTNIETPLATMIEAFRTAMRDMNMSGGQNEAYLVIDDEVMGKVVYNLYNKENRRVGVKMSGA